jgi:hypothetical protein
MALYKDFAFKNSQKSRDCPAQPEKQIKNSQSSGIVQRSLKTYERSQSQDLLVKLAPLSLPVFSSA